MSYTDHSVQRRIKSNAPNEIADWWFSTLLSVKSEHSMLIGYFCFYNGGMRAQLSPGLPPLPLLYPLSDYNYIRRFGTFAFRDRKMSLFNFWTEVSFVNIKSSSSSHFHLKFWGGCASLASPDEPPLPFGKQFLTELFLWRQFYNLKNLLKNHLSNGKVPWMLKVLHGTNNTKNVPLFLSV